MTSHVFKCQAFSMLWKSRYPHTGNFSQTPGMKSNMSLMRGGKTVLTSMDICSASSSTSSRAQLVCRHLGGGRGKYYFQSQKSTSSFQVWFYRGLHSQN